MVEILVALVISLFLLGGIVQVYTGNKTTFKFTNALAEIQETARFALDTMSQDLRLASEWGCVPFDPDDTDNINNQATAGNVVAYDKDWHDFVDEEAIEGTNNGGLNGSDTITIRGGKPGQWNVREPFAAAGNAQITIDGRSRITTDDIVLIARCGANDLLIDAEADVMQVANAVYDAPGDETLLSLRGNKSQRFENDAAVIELQTVTYSIQVSDLGNNVPTLVRAEFGDEQDLVEGVEDMQILYGVDTGTDQFADQYFTADAVEAADDWDNVVAIRIALLVASIDDFVTEDVQTYTFMGQNIVPNDRRIRQVFTTTIALRNRIGSS